MNQIEKFINNLKSPNKNIRYEACEELRVVDSLPESAIAALEAATQDPDPLVADAARRALATHKPSPPMDESSMPGQGSLIQQTLARNRASLISLVAGILSVFFVCLIVLPVYTFNWREHYCGEPLNWFVMVCLPSVALCVIIAIFAVTCGIVSILKIKKLGGIGKRNAIAGIVLGVVSISTLIIINSLYVYFCQ